MSALTSPVTSFQPGCCIAGRDEDDNSCDVIRFAMDHGFIVGPFEQYAVNGYGDDYHHKNFPHEAIAELVVEAVDWLNSGTGVCSCGGSGKVKVAQAVDPAQPIMTEVLCQRCSGTGRGPRVAGQNFPPRSPEGYSFSFTEDGDFGLYPDEDLLD